VSFAGLTYLAIFLSEFVFALPLAHLSNKTTTPMPMSAPIVGSRHPEDEGVAARVENRETPLPRFPIMAAILICGIPLLLAMYIASTRYSDYRHHTFDILAGSILGIFAGVVGWRWYGAWCCASGEGRVYALAAHLRSGGTVVEDVEEGKMQPIAVETDSNRVDERGESHIRQEGRRVQRRESNREKGTRAEE